MHQQPFENTNSRRAIFALMLLLGLFLLVSPLISLQNFGKIEKKEMAEDVLQVHSIINAEVSQLVTTASDYSGWDETYTFMKNHSLGYVKSSLGEAFMTKLRLNLYCLVDNSGAVVFSKLNRYGNAPTLPAPFLAHIKPGSLLLSHKTINSYVAGFLRLPEGLMLLVSQPILTSEYQGPIMGTLLIGRLLDQGEVERIREITKFDLSVVDSDNLAAIPQSRHIVASLDGGIPVAVAVENNDKISGFCYLRDIYGKKAGMIRLNKSRTIYREAEKNSRYIIVASATFSLLTIVILLLYHRKLSNISHQQELAIEQLAESESRWNFALESGGRGVWDCDLAGNRFYTSPQWTSITGFSLPSQVDSIGEFLHRVHPDDLAMVKQDLDRCFSGGDAFRNEYRLRRNDGVFIWVEDQGMVLKRGEDGRPLRIIGTLADISQRKQLEIRLQEKNDRLNRVSIQLTLAEEQERNRIANELHDQVGPNLLFCKIRINQALARLTAEQEVQNLTEVETLISQSIDDIRSLTMQLRPPILVNAGLDASLRWLGMEYQQKHGLCVELEGAFPEQQLPFEVQTTVFHAVRELLLNIVKHAGVSHAVICIVTTDKELAVSVEDRGAGFARNDQQGSGYGLFNLRKKFECFAGRVAIESATGKGCRVTLVLPLDMKLYQEREADP